MNSLSSPNPLLPGIVPTIDRMSALIWLSMRSIPCVSPDADMMLMDFKRTVSARWHTHNIVNGKPKSEFAGPDSSSVTLEAVLAAERGVRPRATLEKLEKACESGTVDYLYIGGKKVGTGKMKLESISETCFRLCTGCMPLLFSLRVPCGKLLFRSRSVCWLRSSIFPSPLRPRTHLTDAIQAPLLRQEASCTRPPLKRPGDRPSRNRQDQDRSRLSFRFRSRWMILFQF